jgi:hypothetical protein
VERDLKMPQSGVTESVDKGGRPRLCAKIYFRGVVPPKKKSLGTFDTREEAEAAWLNAAREHQSAT